jgi:hypothetical protein
MSQEIQTFDRKVTEIYNHLRTGGWCPLYNLVIFLLIYTACNLLWRSSVSIRKPKDFLGDRGEATKQNSSFDRTTKV